MRLWFEDAGFIAREYAFPFASLELVQVRDGDL
jgi:hypothetical protein